MENTAHDSALHFSRSKTTWRKLGLPLLCTSLLLFWLLDDVDFNTLLLILSGYSLPLLISLFAIFVGFFLTLDVLLFHYLYAELLKVKTGMWEMFKIRGSIMCFGAAMPPVAALIQPYYFYRYWQTSAFLTFSVLLFVVVIDVNVSLLFLTVGVGWATDTIFAPWFYALLAYWLILVLAVGIFLIFKDSRSLKSPKSWELLWHCLLNSSFKTICVASINKIISMLGNIVFIACLLSIFDMHMNTVDLILFATLVLTSAFLPVSVGGYGGPQAIAILFLVNLHGLCTKELALAFSLMWSTMFLLARLLLGAALTIPFLSALSARGVVQSRFG